MLREGRAADVTDDMMARVDPQEMHRLYESGATGRAMPMDEASRMGRARDMGFDTDAYKGMGAYSGGPVRDWRGNIVESRPLQEIQEIRSPGTYTGHPVAGFFSDDANVASRFQSWMEDGGAVYPVRLNMGGADAIDMGGQRAAAAQFEAFADPASFERFRRAVGQQEGSGAILRNTSDEANVFVPKHPAQVRSRFARFDPRLSHLANLSAAGAGVATAGALASQPEEGNWTQVRDYLREGGRLE